MIETMNDLQGLHNFAKEVAMGMILFPSAVYRFEMPNAQERAIFLRLLAYEHELLLIGCYNMN